MRACGLLLLLGSACAWAVVPGERPPALADGDISLAAAHGQVVYIDFWASWCAPCRDVMPKLQRLYDDRHGRGFTVIGVNVDTETARARRIAQNAGISFPIVFDPQGIWPERFDLPAMPTGYLIDRRGVVRFVQKGYTANDLPALESNIDDLLKEPSPP